METKEYKTIDKSDWPRGQWNDEPDKVQYLDDKTGLPCLIVRGPSGALCGYVGVDRSHQYYEKDYDDVPVDVHWGLTFSSKCQETDDESKGVCHSVEKGENDDVWWLGFDCAHSGDYCPKYVGNCFADEWYKDIAFVRSECAKLAAQLV